MEPSSEMGRRGFLRLAATGVAGAVVGVPLSACGGSSPEKAGPGPDRRERPTPAKDRSVLLAYFSRPGENYWNGGRRNLRVGNTEVLAGIIAERLVFVPRTQRPPRTARRSARGGEDGVRKVGRSGDRSERSP